MIHRLSHLTSSFLQHLLPVASDDILSHLKSFLSSPSFPFLFRLSFRGSASTFPIHHALRTDPITAIYSARLALSSLPSLHRFILLGSFLLSPSSSSSCLPASARTHPRPRSAPPHPQSSPKSARPLAAGRQVGRPAATDAFHSILVLGILSLLDSCCPRRSASPVLCFFDPGTYFRVA
jgi:hypothetical protein